MKTVKIIRVSDQTRKVEYEPFEIDIIDKKAIVNDYGRCDRGEVIYVEIDGELEHTLYWDDQHKEYRESTGDYYNRFKRI